MGVGSLYPRTNYQHVSGNNVHGHQPPQNVYRDVAHESKIPSSSGMDPPQYSFIAPSMRLGVPGQNSYSNGKVSSSSIEDGALVQLAEHLANAQTRIVHSLEMLTKIDRTR